MATIDIYFKSSKKYKDGTSPVYIRCTIDGITSLKQICKVKESDWDTRKKRVKQSHPNQLHYNNLITTNYTEIEKNFINNQLNENRQDSRNLLHTQKEEVITLQDFMQEYINELESVQKYSSAKRINTFLAGVNKYAKKPINLKRIDEAWIKEYKAFLYKKGNSYNTIARTINAFSTIFNRAIEADLVAKNPVKKQRMTYIKSRKEILSKENIIYLINLDLPKNTNMFHAKNIFLTQYFLNGTRISDVIMLKNEQITEDRILIIQQKTNAILTIKIIPQLQEILQHYKNNEKYLFPFLNNFQTDITSSEAEQQKSFIKKIESITALINSNLKDIAKKLNLKINLSSHIARHSFANHADKAILDKRKISTLLGHTNFKMTENYLKDLRYDELDEDVASVFS